MAETVFGGLARRAYLFEKLQSIRSQTKRQKIPAHVGGLCLSYNLRGSFS
jgi:hypothetical protein